MRCGPQHALGMVVLVVVLVEVVVGVAPEGAHRSFAVLGDTDRVPNWSLTLIGASVVFGHLTL
jgi:hypothetical protein